VIAEVVLSYCVPPIHPNRLNAPVAVLPIPRNCYRPSPDKYPVRGHPGAAAAEVPVFPEPVSSSVDGLLILE
jgi:hypothetical protein